MTDLSGKIVLGANQYGKAENRVVRIHRDTPRHEIHDINVSSALRGNFAPAHLVGDQSNVLPTDTQKQTAYAYAKTLGLENIEEYGLGLARHYVDDVEPVDGARIDIEEYAWRRVVIDGVEHDHTWTRTGEEVRTAAITVENTDQGRSTWVIAGFEGLVILKSTGSEFSGFLEDELTVLEPTNDRMMATSLTAQWRYARVDVDFDRIYRGVKAAMIERFANLHSLALQQTLYSMGEAVLAAFPCIAEIRMSAPNKHHFLYDLERFGIENRGEVFHADDRPYGLIKVTVEREDAPHVGSAWRTF